MKTAWSEQEPLSMQDPLVSVKMITYNHAPFIVQAIEGVLQQKTNFPFELVIGEDCSTDGTREIVFEYQKKHPHIIRVITSDANVGARRNGYRTTKACRGKYLAFCEGDDYWHHPEKLQKQVDYLEGHPECGLVYADCDVHNVKSDELKRSINYDKGFKSPLNLSIEQILDYGGIVKWTCAVVARRALCEQVIESDPYLHQNEKFLMGDVQLWAELAFLSKVTYIPECLATYRILDESASNSKDPRKILRFWISASEIRMYLCDKHKLPDSIRRKAESVWCEKTLHLAFHERNVDLALEVKRKKQTFTWKEHLLYYGAKYLTVNHVYRAAVSFRNIFRKECNQWL